MGLLLQESNIRTLRWDFCSLCKVEIIANGIMIISEHNRVNLTQTINVLKYTLVPSG